MENESMKPMQPELDAEMKIRECQIDILSCMHSGEIPGWVAHQVARVLVRRGWVKQAK